MVRYVIYITICLLILDIWVETDVFAKSKIISRSLVVNFQYLYMNMGEYKIYKNNLKLIMPNSKNFRNGYGGTIEIRQNLFKNLFLGLELGLIYGDVQSDKKISDELSPIPETTIRYEKLFSIFSVPFNSNFYYYLMDRHKSKIFMAYGLGIWYSKLRIVDNITFNSKIINTLNYTNANLYSKNFVHAFILGHEYHIHPKLGLISKLYYRIAKFKGFKGKGNLLINSSSKELEKDFKLENIYDTRLIYNFRYHYWGIERENLAEGAREGHADVGNWGLSVGLVWYLN